MSYSGIGDGLQSLFKLMAWTIAIAVPLGIWKLIEIGIWTFHKITG